MTHLLPRSTPLRRALREPLLHFVAVGALLFGIDHLVASRQDDPLHIVVGAEADREIRGLYRDAKGHEPSDAELASLRQRWADNEVLYREGKAMGVDQGDSTIRDRVIFKALNVVQANLAPPPIGEDGLRTWFDARRERYGEPARIDFLEAVLPGDAGDDAVQGFVAALNSAAAGTAQGGLRVYKGRPRDNIVQAFGADFATALQALPLGRWQALASREGLRVVRLDAVHAAVPAAFEAVRGEVLQDWKDEQLTALRTQAVRDVAKKYTVVYEPAKAAQAQPATRTAEAAK